MVTELAQPIPAYVEQARLTAADLQQLTREPSAKIRAELCEKICACFNDKIYSPREADLAIEIIRLLVRDTSIRVRRTISEQLAHNRDIPHDIALKLANDEDIIAEAILSHSPVLNEEDLLAIIHSTHSLRKLLAIAGRDSLSAGTAKALIDNGTQSVTLRVIHNSKAALTDETMHYLLEEYYQDDSILDALVHRGNLPYSVAQKLFYLVGSHYRQQLSKQYHLREESIEDASTYGTEHSMLRFLSPWMGQQDVQQLIQELYQQEKLTDSLIIRSLCIGDLRFFQTAMAKRAGVSVSNAKLLLLDPQHKGFYACYEKAGLPDSLKEAVCALYFCALEESQLGRVFHDQFTAQVIARIIKQGYDKSIKHMQTIIGMLHVSMQEDKDHAARKHA
jgi:uncharacterized protein (DUF2336 family)